MQVCTSGAITKAESNGRLCECSQDEVSVQAFGVQVSYKTPSTKKRQHNEPGITPGFVIFIVLVVLGALAFVSNQSKSK
jgi:hypothetical protein